MRAARELWFRARCSKKFMGCWWSNTRCQQKNDLTQMRAKFHLYPFQGACCLVYLRSVAALSSPFLETVPFSLGKSALWKHQNGPLPASFSLAMQSTGWYMHAVAKLELKCNSCFLGTRLLVFKTQFLKALSVSLYQFSSGIHGRIVDSAHDLHLLSSP